MCVTLDWFIITTFDPLIITKLSKFLHKESNCKCCLMYKKNKILETIYIFTKFCQKEKMLLYKKYAKISIHTPFMKYSTYIYVYNCTIENVLDKQKKIISCILYRKISVFFSLENCTIFKIW